MKLNFHFPHKTCLLAVFGLLLFSQAIHAQDRDIYGNKVSSELCDQMEFDTDEEVQRLVTKLLEAYNLPNRYIIGPCSRVSNCVATRDERGRPYILYNPAFLDKIKVFAFTETDLPTAAEDWAVLLVLAHEIGHHLNNHIINPHPDLTQRDMELEADETAGYLLYLLNAPDLKTAQKGLQAPQVSEAGSYTHPPRSERLAAFRKGWDKAAERFPRYAEEQIEDTRFDCGASVAFGEWRTFMCHNLGVLYPKSDPLAPGWQSIGGYWQWGRGIMSVPGPDGNTSESGIVDWDTTQLMTEIWTEPYKSENDPCPDNFRLPTKAEWDGLVANNTYTTVGTWDDTSKNYSSGIRFGEKLFLPAAGLRSAIDGELKLRGSYGYYWSSTRYSSNYSWALFLSSGGVGTGSFDNISGISVRCIAD